jgi:hypothetical protein
MKIIIISDIRSNSKSVIPYGLKLARSMESEVDVVHVVDPRIHQGKYSPFSDSRSFTPGHKLTPGEMIRREMDLVRIELDKLLSGEGSRLNYPLKVNTFVEKNSIQAKIEKIAKKETSWLLVTSSEPDNHIFISKKEIYSTLKDTGAAGIIVPPEAKFREYKKIIHLVDFSSDELDNYADLRFFFTVFQPVVNAVAVANGNKYLSLETKSKAWRRMVGDVFLPSDVKSNVLEGEDFTKTLINYSKRNEYDLFMLFPQMKNLKKNLKKENIQKIVTETNLPMLYYRKKK